MALARNVIIINEANWLSDHEGNVQVKLRSVSKPYEATLLHNTDGTSVIALDDAQYGISPGQAAVVYNGNRIIGGGWIVKTRYEQTSKVA